MEIQKYKLGDVVEFNIDVLNDYSSLPEYFYCRDGKFEGTIIGVELLNDKENYFVRIDDEEIWYVIGIHLCDITKLVKEGLGYRKNLCNYCKLRDLDICLECPYKKKLDNDNNQLYIGDSVLFSNKRYIILGTYHISSIETIDDMMSIQHRHSWYKKSAITYFNTNVEKYDKESRNIYLLLREYALRDCEIKLERKFYSYINSRSIKLIEKWKIEEEPKRLHDFRINDLCKICPYEEDTEACWDCIKR